MSLRYGDFDWAVIAVASVLLVFFFPAAHGSFAAVHGPATALRAMRYCALLWEGLALLLPVFAGYAGLRYAARRPCRNEVFFLPDVLSRLSTRRC